jgi:uracil phosphoribosyltransferase
MEPNNLILLDGHALIEHKLGQMRHKDCPHELFRRRLREIGSLLATVVADDLQTVPIDVPTPLEVAKGKKLASFPVIVPILRAGLGLAEGITAVLTEADIGHIGLKRDEKTLLPESYLTNVPPLAGRDVIVADPMLATGGSLLKAIEILLAHGAEERLIQVAVLVAAPEGITAVQAAYPQVRLVIAALDRELNDRGFICPGLGDAGDRMFGTV